MTLTSTRNSISFGRPNPKQEEFLTSKERYIAYGGARGGGKSWALRFKLTLLCLKQPGIRCLLIRRTYAELYENHIRELKKTIPDVIACYKSTDKAFEFSNGSVLKLGYCDRDDDVDQYQGQQYDIIAFDEATQLTEYQFQTLKGALRGANNFPKHMFLTCNPGGVGHSWVKRLFIDRAYRPEEDGNDYRFIPATLYDNKHLLNSDPDYEKNLLSLPEDIRAAWLYGRWDIFDGQFFREFDKSIHCTEPFDIPKEWYRYRAFDYGLDMLACLWIAVDTQGSAYVYRELNMPNLIVSEAAAKILEATGKDEKIEETYCPPDLWSRQRDSGKSAVEILRENGLDVIRASNDRVQGWLQVKEYLKPQARRDIITGNESVYSRLCIMKNCKELIRNIPLLQYDSQNTNDAATQPHDITHNTDALRYFCISRSLTPKEPEKPQSKTDEYRRFVFSNKSRKRW